MSAGTIVISGGILAGVILLCIVAVLCYCRLQVPLCHCIFYFLFFLIKTDLDPPSKCMEKVGRCVYRLLRIYKVQSELKIRFLTIWGILLKIIVLLTI